MQSGLSEKIKSVLTITTFDRWVSLTTICANIGLIFAIIYTNANFDKEIYNENRNFAVSIYKDYSDLVLSQNNRPFLDTAYTNQLDKISDDYKYFVGFVLFYAESIFTMMYENEAWVSTVKYMLQPHLKYIKSAKIIDQAYDIKFQEFYKEVLRENSN